MTLLERAQGLPDQDGPVAPPHGLVDRADHPADDHARQPTVLVFGQDHSRRDQIVEIIEHASWLALVANDRNEVVHIVRGAPPDLFVLVLQADDSDELDLLDEVRSTVDGELVPIVCVLDRRHRGLTIDAFGRRADDVVWGTPDRAELIARLRTRIDRRPIPTTELVEDPVTGALTPRAFAIQLGKERERVARGGRPGSVAFLSLDELPGIAARHGSRARDELVAQVVRLIERDGRQLDFVGSRRGVLALLLPATPLKGTQTRLDRLARKIYDHEFTFGDTTVSLTPIIGFTATVPDVAPDELERRAWDAMSYQASHLDLHPTQWVPAMSPTPKRPASLARRAFERVRTPTQVLAQQLIALLAPLTAYALLDRVGVDVTGAMYLVIVTALAVTAAGILIESSAALAPTIPPDPRPGPPPPASAIIAAYLPNEAETVLDTIDAFLALDYPGLEIILAYNTPQTLPVEAELARIAERDLRFRPLRVEGSASKAQNVNAALAHVRGHFVGLFDADHHPASGSFHRAWQWIDAGAGVVQGHCVIRNGDLNAVTRIVAVEFESIYAVSHPGRARVHGFGIFGGSNGYWRTSLLHRTRMRGSMLTEDIDSSMRVVESGETIISDPDLVSTELAPETLSALWNQRLRWAQGWSQVSLRHLMSMMRAAPTWRQRAGVFYLLGWREVYPWISLQMFPLLAYWWLRGDAATNWFLPIFVLTTVFTMSVGPLQTWFAYRLAHPSIKGRRRWFLGYLALSTVLYTEFKNVVGRTAQIKEAMRERKWKVTPRTGSIAIDTGTSLEHTPAPVPDPTPAESADAVAAPDSITDVVRSAIEPDGTAPGPTNRIASPELVEGDRDLAGPDPVSPARAGETRDSRRHRGAARQPVHRSSREDTQTDPAKARGPADRTASVGTSSSAIVEREVERPVIYDVEREVERPVIYDVEREVERPVVDDAKSSVIHEVDQPGIDDVERVPMPRPSAPGVTGPRPGPHGPRRERPAMPAGRPIDPTTVDERRPMIAGVDGVSIAPTRRLDPVGDRPARTTAPRVAPLLAATNAPGEIPRDDTDESHDPEALRPRRVHSGQANPPGAPWSIAETSLRDPWS